MNIRYKEMAKVYDRNILRLLDDYSQRLSQSIYEMLICEISEYAGYALANGDYNTYDYLYDIKKECIFMHNHA